MRLDFFLVSDTLCYKVLEAEISPGYRTDHSMITVRISAAVNPRGPGFWKLTETDYVTLIKKTIADVLMEYDGQCEVDEVLKWDVIRMQIRAASIKYAAAKTSSLNKKEHTLEENILRLERKFDERNLSEADRKNLESKLAIKRQQLDELIGYKTQGAILRLKVKWYNEGERNIYYIFMV